MTSATIFHGILRRDGDGVSAVIEDGIGYRITLTGTRCAEGYALTGVRGEPPDWLKLPTDVDLPEPAPRSPSEPDKPIKPPKPGQSRMFDGWCPDCGVFHDPPACGHDSGKPCPGCQRPFGFLTRHMSGDVCVRCEHARGGAV